MCLCLWWSYKSRVQLFGSHFEQTLCHWCHWEGESASCGRKYHRRASVRTPCARHSKTPEHTPRTPATPVTAYAAAAPQTPSTTSIVRAAAGARVRRAPYFQSCHKSTRRSSASSPRSSGLRCSRCTCTRASCYRARAASASPPRLRTRAIRRRAMRRPRGAGKAGGGPHRSRHREAERDQ